MIGAETGQADIGSDLIALKMSEIILAQALRQFLAGEGAAAAGLAGFTDPKLPHTLSAMRRNPDQQWTAADLARTGFALRRPDGDGANGLPDLMAHADRAAGAAL